MPGEYYRGDGVRICHDPYAPEMAAKYGLPGATDNEGFDPYADTVGPGIYGGIVERDENGEVVIGRQYQNHNPRPGPVYAGGGYTPINRALKDHATLRTLLEKYPELANDISTGGAQPLHMCGMGRDNQKATSIIIAHGGDIEALDTYGFTPLHRMASNNLATGAQALLNAGADPNNRGSIWETPYAIASGSAAKDVLRVLEEHKRIHGNKRKPVEIKQISVIGSGEPEVNLMYTKKSASHIPVGFAEVCKSQGWQVSSMWQDLNNGKDWYGAENGAYIYFNERDLHWWIDKPDGGGVYIAKGPQHAVPSTGWKSLGKSYQGPVVLTSLNITE